jgi:hypothetical protein
LGKGRVAQQAPDNLDAVDFVAVYGGTDQKCGTGPATNQNIGGHGEIGIGDQGRKRYLDDLALTRFDDLACELERRVG